MTPDTPPSQLGKLPTLWTVLRQAHEGTGDEAEAARARLWDHYGDAVRRYLRALLGDPLAAEDLAQEFALGLVRGDFRNAAPEHGRFRNYVKVALRHLVTRYRARQRKLPAPVAPDDHAIAELAANEEENRFDWAWGEELIRQALAALARENPDFHVVLQYRAANPRTPSNEMAAALSQLLGKPVTASGVRQTLRRARLRLWELLREQVAESLDSPTPEQVTEELQELGLSGYAPRAGE